MGVKAFLICSFVLLLVVGKCTASSCESDFQCASIGICEFNSTVGHKICMPKKQLLEQCEVKRQCSANNPALDCRRDSKMGPFMYCHCNETLKLQMSTKQCVDKNFCAQDKDCDANSACVHQRCATKRSGTITITTTTTENKKRTTSSRTNSAHRSNGGKTGLIIGIVLALVIIGGVILFFVCKNRNDDVVTGCYVSPAPMGTVGYAGAPHVGYAAPVIAPTVVVGPSFGYGPGFGYVGGYGGGYGHNHSSTEMLETTTTTTTVVHDNAGYAPAPESYSNNDYYSPSCDTSDFYSPCD